MNRKLLALCAAGLMCMSVAACSDSGGTASETPAEATEAAATQEAAEAPTEEPTEAPTEEATVDAAASETVKSQLAQGDFEGALSTARNAGLNDLSGKLESLNTAAADCYVNVDPFNKNAIVYGNENVLIGPDVSLVPFVNLSANLIRMQMGFRESFGASDFSGVWATQVDLATATEHWSWPVDYDEFVSPTDDDGVTWVFETTLTDDAIPILTAVGASAPGEVLMRFSDPATGQKDITVTDAQIEACAHIGTFVAAYQDVMAAL